MIVVFVILEIYPKLKANQLGGFRRPFLVLRIKLLNLENMAYFSYVKFQLLSTQVMMRIRKKSDTNLPTIIRKVRSKHFYMHD